MIALTIISLLYYGLGALLGVNVVVSYISEGKPFGDCLLAFFVGLFLGTPAFIVGLYKGAKHYK